MEDFTQLPAVGLDYAGATAQAAPRLGPTPEEIVPPHIAAVIDARAKAAKSTISEAALLDGSGRGKTLLDQVQEALGGPLQPYNQWEAQYGQQAPDTSGALANYQQAGANRPQMPDVGRPEVDQTQQFIASLGALFDPKNAGQILGLPTQNANQDYEFKVKDAMRRYQMNNQDYEAKLELAKAVYENVQKEANAVRGENKAGYSQYAQTYRTEAGNIARDINTIKLIEGRKDVALTNRETRLLAINAQLVGKTKQQLMGIALQAGDPLEREAAALKLYEIDGTVVTPPKTTGKERELTRREKAAEANIRRVDSVINSAKIKDRLTEEQIKTLKEKGKYLKDDALSKIAQRYASIQNMASMIGSRGIRDAIAGDSLELRKNGQGISGLRGELYQAGATMRALDKQIADARDADDMELVAALQDERELHSEAYNDAKAILAGVYSQYNMKVPVKPGPIKGTTGNKTLDKLLDMDGSDGFKPLGKFGGGGLPSAGGMDELFDPNKKPPVDPRAEARRRAAEAARKKEEARKREQSRKKLISTEVGTKYKGAKIVD